MTTGQKLVPRGTGHCEDDNAWAEFCRQYGNKAREDLAAGKLTDFHLANAIYMADRNSLDLIGLQTAVKERIRWLSVELAKALAPAAPAQEPVGEVFYWEDGEIDVLWSGQRPPFGTALYAAPTAPVAPAPVAVKALEWFRAADWKAETSFGGYGIRRYPEGFGVYFPGTSYRDNPDGYYPTLEAAKAAAQADYERRVRACLADAPVAAGWQPIEGAPKDGTAIIGFENGRVFNCRFRDLGDGEAFWDDDLYSDPEPTHWMPLPAAPGEG